MQIPIQITPQQSNRIQGALLRIYLNSGSFDNGLSAIGERYATHETGSLNYALNVQKIVGEAAADGWLMDFINATLQRVPDQDLQAIQHELKPYVIAAQIDPFQVCRLSGSNVMLDRTDLRVYLDSLNNPNGKRILVVKGTRKSGKSHTLQLLSYEERRLGGFRILPLNLERLARDSGVAVKNATNTAPIQIATDKPHGFTSGNSVFVDGITGLLSANGLWMITVTGPSEFALVGSSGNGVYVSGGVAKLQTPVEASLIAENLAELLPYDVKLPDPPNDAQWAKWVNSFCNRLQKSVLSAPGPQPPLWIVIDAFHAVSLAQSAVDLIRQLANRINETLPQLRLVLLGFEDSLPADVGNHLVEETINPIGRSELITFIGSALKQMQVPNDGQKIADVFASVVVEANPSDPDFLPKIGPVATRELQKVEAQR